MYLMFWSMSANNRIVSIVDDDKDITMLFQGALRTIAAIRMLTFTDPILALEHFLVRSYLRSCNM
jgi:hypothetical protein